MNLGSLQEILGLHIRLAHGTVYRHFTDTFAYLELTQQQVSVLWIADEQPGLSQSGIGQRLHIDRATMMAIVNRLQGRGLIDRRPSTRDRRSQALHLTSEGTAVLAVARTAIVQHEDWLKGRFTEAEVGALRSLLERIHS